VVQEIVLRRQINAMGLDRDQIEKILPPLRSMLSSCRDFEKQMKNMFARERNRTATDETSKEKLQELRREAAEARKRFIRGQSELEREIGNVLSEEQSAAVKRMLYAPLLHDEALSSEDKERLRRQVQEHRQEMALQECRKGIREGGCVVPPPPGPDSDNKPHAPKAKRINPLSERSKRLEQIIGLLEEKLKAVP
ncbi:MAG: hypothetical protein PHT33_12555, partial [bacterium]|nr:hypothetical protein [bacterium]